MNKEIQMLRTLMIKYYEKYYKDELGLPDYAQRVQRRLDEEVVFAEPNIERLRSLTNFSFNSDLKVLIIGGGTGAEFICFSKLGCDTYCIEPNPEAVEIMKIKCEINDFGSHKVVSGIAEKMPFDSNYFDLIYCFTVLEHVENVERVIKEAIRVTKPGGHLFFVTPDYRQFYEGHYKLYMPMFMPKPFLKSLLKIYKRPTGFINTLNFVTAKQLRNIFRQNDVIAMRIYFSYKNSFSATNWQDKIIKFFQDKLGIEKDQFWLVKKS